MIVDRYYLSNLNKEEQQTYKAIYKGLMNHVERIQIPFKIGSNSASLNRVVLALVFDNPLIYFIETAKTNILTNGVDEVYFCPNYIFTKEEIQKYNQVIQSKVNQIIQRYKLNQGTIQEKEKRLHDYICRKVTYDHKGMDKSNYKRYVEAHSILGF